MAGQYGPFLIGIFLNLMIYGGRPNIPQSVVTQTIRYFVTYKKYYSYIGHHSKCLPHLNYRDARFIKCLMSYLLLAETAVIVVQCAIVYQPLIIDAGTEAAKIFAPRLLPGESLLIASVLSLISAPIQIFSGWRVKVITGSLVLPGIIMLFSLGSFAAGMTMFVKVLLHPQFRDFPTFTTTATVWLSLSATCDVIIALGLSYALYSRKAGLIGGIDSQLNRIIRLTLETGALTALTALLDVILFLTIPETSTNFIADMPLSGVYVWSMLAMLNSRSRTSVDDLEHHGTSLRFSQAPSIFRLEQTSASSTAQSHGFDSPFPMSPKGSKAEAQHVI
ncbi:hypothetical protein R3P38DRAFT_3284360 [Favolaschia claudopus]|uniref:DUF6534 domain-containing protein n=1 Tax=Favolaschia claudopus TaxID=2862362 RepID=A0AAW0A5U2_9AGAR